MLCFRGAVLSSHLLSSPEHYLLSIVYQDRDFFLKLYQDQRQEWVHAIKSGADSAKRAKELADGRDAQRCLRIFVVG
jgi:hypothetical protein